MHTWRGMRLPDSGTCMPPVHLPWREAERRPSSQILAVPAGRGTGRAVLDNPDGPVTKPVVEIPCQHVIGEAHDQSAASAPRRGLGLSHEFACQPVTALRAVDPERVDLAASA